MANTKKYVSLDKLSLYDQKIKKVITDSDASTLASAKSYAESYANGLAVNYDAAGAAATAEANAKAYADGKDAAIAEAKKAGTDAAAAAATADGKAVAAQTAADNAQAAVDTLEAYVGTIPSDYTETNVVAYINKKAQETLDAASGGSSESAASVLAALNTYKADNDPKVNKNTEDIAALGTSLDEVSAVANAAVKQSDYNTKVAALEAEDTRIEGLVTAEAERAAEVESDFEERIAKMEVFWDTTDDADGIVNKLKEIQDYIAGDETGAAEMAGNIQANTQAIAAMDAAYKAADQTLQGNIDLKADASDVETLAGKVTALETASATHATKDEVKEVSDALSAYETAHAGDYTNAQVDAAIKVVANDVAKLNDTYATDAELTAAIEAEVTRANGAYAAKSLETTVSELSATVDTKAAQSEVTTISGDVATLKTDMAQAKTDIDAVEAKAAANESAIGTLNTTVAGKAAQSDLTAVDNRVTAIETWHSNFVEVSEEEINGLFA